MLEKHILIVRVPHLRLQQRLVLVVSIVHRRKRVTHRIMWPLPHPRSRPQSSPPTNKVSRTNRARHTHQPQPLPSILRKVHHSPQPRLRRLPPHNRVPVFQTHRIHRHPLQLRRAHPAKTPQHQIPHQLAEILATRSIHPRPRRSHNQQPSNLSNRQQLNLRLHFRRQLNPLPIARRRRIHRQSAFRNPPIKQRPQIAEIPLLSFPRPTIPRNPSPHIAARHRVTELRFPPPHKRQTRNRKLLQIPLRLPELLLSRKTPRKKLPQSHRLHLRFRLLQKKRNRLLDRTTRSRKRRIRRRIPHPQILTQTHRRIPMPLPFTLLRRQSPRRLIPRRKIDLPTFPRSIRLSDQPIIELPRRLARLVNDPPNLHATKAATTHVQRTSKVASMGKNRHFQALDLKRKTLIEKVRKGSNKGLQSPATAGREMVRDTGFEPVTPTVSR